MRSEQAKQGLRDLVRATGLDKQPFDMLELGTYAGDGAAVNVRWWSPKLMENQWAFQKYAFDIVLRVEI